MHDHWEIDREVHHCRGLRKRSSGNLSSSSRYRRVAFHTLHLKNSIRFNLPFGKKRLTSQAFYGLEVERGSNFGIMDYRALDFFWLQEALEAGEPLLIKA